MEANNDRIKEYYSGLADDELKDLLLFESHELTTQAVDILKSEILNRGFGDKFREILEIQFAGINHPEAQKLVARIRNLPCPRCEKRIGNMNAARLRRVFGFMIIAREVVETVIACGECISNAAKNSNRSNFIMGWWAFLLSIFQNIRAINNNFKYYDLELATEPTPYFNELIGRNIGILYKYFQKDDDLKALVKNPEILRGLNIRKAYLEDHGKR